MVLVDTNIVFPLLAESVNTQPARELLDRDAAWVTEPYALIELTNILTTYQRANLISKTQALELLQRAVGFLEPYFMGISHEHALDVAIRYKVSAYDARYIALAEKLDTPLITEDNRLRKAVPDRTISLKDALIDSHN